MKFQNKKALIIGSGLSGSTAANILAKNGWSVELHESEYQVGGHVKTFTLGEIMYEGNAIHFCHTDKDEVIEFLEEHSEWVKTIHTVKTEVDLGILSWPPQIDELMMTDKWNQIKEELDKLPESPDNSSFETYAISIMGETLYKSFIYSYTKKQWNTEPKNLSSSFAPKRIDLRYDGYRGMFRNKWQGWPKEGWTKLIHNILTEYPIKIIMGKKDYIDTVKWDQYDAVIVTAPLDEFMKKENLPWRGVRVEHEYIPGIAGCYLPAGQVNHPGLDEEYTRRTETKHMSGQKDKVLGTIVTKEYPSNEFKHYPIEDIDGNNRKKANILKAELRKLHPNVIICGRLANYVYINTDQAVMQGINAAKEAMNRNKK